MELSFIIIDDTELDHFIARKMIGNVSNAYTVKSFLDASSALEHIIANEHEGDIKIILVFLDIYMPMMNGFDFVEEFEKLPSGIKDKYMIVILSSTRNSNDISRILTYSSVHSLIEKPITREKLLSLILQGKTGF